jgi:hypothetical protein
MLFRTEYEFVLARALLGIQMWVSLGELWRAIPKCARCGCALDGVKDDCNLPRFCGWGCMAEFHGASMV